MSYRRSKRVVFPVPSVNPTLASGRPIVSRLTSSNVTSPRLPYRTLNLYSSTVSASSRTPVLVRPSPKSPFPPPDARDLISANATDRTYPRANASVTPCSNMSKIRFARLHAGNNLCMETFIFLHSLKCVSASNIPASSVVVVGRSVNLCDTCMHRHRVPCESFTRRRTSTIRHRVQRHAKHVRHHRRRPLPRQSRRRARRRHRRPRRPRRPLPTPREFRDETSRSIDRSRRVPSVCPITPRHVFIPPLCMQSDDACPCRYTRTVIT